MMCDGTKDGMLGWLQSELASWRWLDVCGIAEVLDAVPRDRFKPPEVHDLLIQSKGLFTTGSSSAGAAVEA